METSETTAKFKQYLMRSYGDRSTPKHYWSDLHVFSLHLDAKSIVEATKADIESFVDEKQKPGLAPTTINRRLDGADHAAQQGSD
jgi:site-specific recombinase XerD